MRRQSGITLVELLVAMAILGLCLTASTIYLKSTDNPLKTGSILLEASMREARLMAIAETAAYRLAPQGTRTVRMERAASCGDTTWTDAPTPSVPMPDGVTIVTEGWTVCFNSRGISSDNVVIELSHAEYGARKVEVLLGGTTRVLD
jgi:prepilin-type N-terminal cleavage/methylation domain-containing protein